MAKLSTLLGPRWALLGPLCLLLAFGLLARSSVQRGQQVAPPLHDDPPPPGYSRQIRNAPLVIAQATSGVCDGNGVSGKRVQVLYTRASDVASQYTAYLSSFQSWAVDVDAIFNESAAETGGSRRVRFVHDANCTPTVLDVQLSPAGDDSFEATINELLALGYNHSDRRYLLFMDAAVYCGIGDTAYDDRPGAENVTNSGVAFARVDSGCWSSVIAAHELMHTFGGVQLSAPHSSGGWHCTDTADRMCYSDAPNFPPMTQLCPNQHDRLFDCNHDDYFSTNPPAGSYLMTHWNSANNQFLIGAPTPVPPVPSPTPCYRGNSGKPCNK